ncbi:MAG: DUF2934 domain-containing protein [Candidatus Acidiferrales bacterium]
MADFPTRKEIELRAYDLYVERGCEDGHAVEDWLEAERQLFEEHGASPTKRSEEAPRRQRSAAAGRDRA